MYLLHSCYVNQCVEVVCSYWQIGKKKTWKCSANDREMIASRQRYKLLKYCMVCHQTTYASNPLLVLLIV
jgi:hypothetical protein